jgi:hypothetical protein
MYYEVNNVKIVCVCVCEVVLEDTKQYTKYDWNIFVCSLQLL